MAIAPQAGDSALYDSKPGVLLGLIVRDPQSATLTATVEGGVVRILDSNNRLTEFTIAEATKAFTASKDTYVYINGSGAVAYLEVANGAAKPSQATLISTGGTGSYYIAKVVTDGTRVTDGGVTDLRPMSAGDIRDAVVALSFEASEVGAYYWYAPTDCRILRIQSIPFKAVAATDNGTITAAVGVNDKYTAVTTGVVTHTASDAIGQRRACFPTAVNFVQKGQVLRLTTAKATGGGKLNVQITFGVGLRQ